MPPCPLPPLGYDVGFDVDRQHIGLVPGGGPQR